jgi:hypothetical protein
MRTDADISIPVQRIPAETGTFPKVAKPHNPCHLRRIAEIGGPRGRVQRDVSDLLYSVVRFRLYG